MRWLQPREEIIQNSIVATFESVSELMEGKVTVTFIKGGRPVNPDICNALLIFTSSDLKADDVTDLDRRAIQKGDAGEGTARRVYPFLNSRSLSFRAGLTVHDAFGTWSSLPHAFELTDLQKPKPNPFYEQFAYVTQPAGEWGIQTRIGHLFTEDYKSFDPNYRWANDTVTFKDRDIVDIPLGVHPVTAGPGVRLAYFWMYYGGLQQREKFEVA
jgi:5-deoxy-D-glucuronate isomerase